MKMEIEKISKGIGILIIEGLLIYFNVLGKLLDFFDIFTNAFVGIIIMFAFLFLALLMLVGFPYSIYLIWKGFKK